MNTLGRQGLHQANTTKINVVQSSSLCDLVRLLIAISQPFDWTLKSVGQEALDMRYTALWLEDGGVVNSVEIPMDISKHTFQVNEVVVVVVEVVFIGMSKENIRLDVN